MAKDRARDERRVFKNPISHVKVMPSGSADSTKRDAFGNTEGDQKFMMKYDAQEVEAQKESRTKEYGGNPDGYYEIRTNKPSTWRA